VALEYRPNGTFKQIRISDRSRTQYSARDYLDPMAKTWAGTLLRRSQRDASRADRDAERFRLPCNQQFRGLLSDRSWIAIVGVLAVRRKNLTGAQFTREALTLL
jgi:hypothetical protein